MKYQSLSPKYSLPSTRLLQVTSLTPPLPSTRQVQALPKVRAPPVTRCPSILHHQHPYKSTCPHPSCISKCTDTVLLCVSQRSGGATGDCCCFFGGWLRWDGWMIARGRGAHVRREGHGFVMQNLWDTCYPPLPSLSIPTAPPLPHSPLDTTVISYLSPCNHYYHPSSLPPSPNSQRSQLLKHVQRATVLSDSASWEPSTLPDNLRARV